MSSLNECRSICVYCGKCPVKSSSGNGIGDRNVDQSEIGTIATIKRFLKLFLRYANDQNKQEIERILQAAQSLNCCTDCLLILVGFCDIYNQMKCLELQLEWTLQRLLNIMKLAEIVYPGIVKEKEKFKNNNAAGGCNNGISIMEEHVDCIENFKLFREKFIKTCTNHLSKSLPRVSLERNSFGSDGIDKKHKMEIIQPEAIMHKRLVDWMMSFAAVIVLLIPSPGDVYPKLEINISELLSNDIIPEDSKCDVAKQVGLESTSFPVKDLLSSTTCSYITIDSTSNSELISEKYETLQQEDQRELKRQPVECLSDNADFEGAVCPDSIQMDMATEEQSISATVNYVVKSEITSACLEDAIGLFPPLDMIYESDHNVCAKFEAESENDYDDTDAESNISDPDFRATESDLNMSDSSVADVENEKEVKIPEEQMHRLKGKSDTETTATAPSKEINELFECTSVYPVTVKAEQDTHENAKSFICTKCDKNFSREYGLKRHMKQVHTSMIFKCPECDKTYKQEAKLTYHLQSHKNSDSCGYQCSICQKKFASRNNMNKHKRTHKNDSGICTFCNKQFPNKLHLGYHVRKEHIDKGDVGDTKLYQCPHCAKHFIDKKVLRKHVKRVHGAASHQCSECGKLCKTNSQLNNHMLMHKGPSAWKFKCSKCGYMCQEKRRLELHMVAHEKRTSIGCKLCSREFVSNQALSQHVRIEHIDKGDVGNHTVFSCSECDSKFIEQQSLRNHIEAVHGDRVHQCPECYKGFKTKRKLRIHMPLHKDSSTWKFQCLDCGQRFVQKSQMHSHMLTNHNNARSQPS